MTWQATLSEAEAVFADWYQWRDLEPSHEHQMLLLAHLAYAHARFALELGRCSGPEEVINDIGALMATAFEIGRASVVVDAPPSKWERLKGWKS